MLGLADLMPDCWLHQEESKQLLNKEIKITLHQDKLGDRQSVAI
jgi:hypothetical protein